MDGKEHRHKSRRNVRVSDTFVKRIKKLIEDYEKLAERVPESAQQRTYQGVGFHDYDEEPCAVRSFMRDHPDHKGPIWIACPCRRCSVWC